MNKGQLPLGINFRYEVSAQERKVDTQKVQQGMGGFARILLRDVALRTSRRFYQRARRAFEENVKKDVLREITQMTKMIERFVVQPDGARGPRGVVTPAQKVVADTARQLGRINYFELSDSDAFWQHRSLKYINQKKEARGHTDWWVGSGALIRQLKNTSYLISKLGPVSVRFTKVRDQSLENPVKTLTGRPGRAAETFTLGRLEVITFGNITPSMLPSLGSGNVGDVTPRGGQYIPELLGGKTEQKLMTFSSGEGNLQRKYRPVLEPFVSYYLTRAIPNTVFKRMETQFGRDNPNNKNASVF